MPENQVDDVRVRLLRPDVALVNVLWTQTGSKAPDGKDPGIRKGLASWVVTKDGGVWQVAVMHKHGPAAGREVAGGRR